MNRIRRILLIAGMSALLVLAGANHRAGAHPLGNFTINHHVGIHLAGSVLSLDYVLDMAEIPAFAELREIGASNDPDAMVGYASPACDELSGGLRLALDGKAIELDLISASASTPPGNSGVPTLRVECGFRAMIGGGTLVVENTNHEDRIGWREMVATSEDLPITTDLPPVSPSARLTSYPTQGLASVPDVRKAVIEIGHGTVVTSSEPAPAPVTALGSLVQAESLGLGSALAATAAALALGAGHALAPGHGKTVVAAYLVGSRGSVRQAVVLALTTAISHTIGVAVLGVIAATATVTFEPAVIYPYLSVIAGLVVLGIGARLWWHLLQGVRRHHDHESHHGHDHSHPSSTLGWRSVAALGLSGGLVPSASAVVLLLGAIGLGQAWFGVILVAAFGVGMSLALVGSGLLAVLAQRWGWRVFAGRPSRTSLVRWVPRVAAGAVVVLGAIMTIRAFGDISIIG